MSIFRKKHFVAIQGAGKEIDFIEQMIMHIISGIDRHKDIYISKDISIW